MHPVRFYDALNRKQLSRYRHRNDFRLFARDVRQANRAWATFRHRLEVKGFSAEEIAQVTCPIGLPDITGKQPEVIAVSVAAQLLSI